MKIYTAYKEGKKEIYGTFTQIAEALKVSRQAVFKAYNNNSKCKGYSIIFSVGFSPNKKITQKEKLHTTLNTLKRARIIIDEINEKLCDYNEYAYTNIIKDIDKCLKFYNLDMEVKK